MRIKKLSKTDFESFLIDFNLTGVENLPFLQNYISYEDGNLKHCNMYGFLYFLRREVNNFKNNYDLCGMVDLQEYLDLKYPPIKKPSEGLEELADHLRHNYGLDEEVEISEILGLIDEFK